MAARAGILLGALTAAILPMAGSTRGASPNPRPEDGCDPSNPTTLRVRILGGVLPIVQGRVGGQGKVNIFIDTGTSPTVIDSGLAQSLGVQTFAGSSLQLLDSAQPAGWTRIPDLQIGPVHKQVVPAMVRDLSYLKRKYGVSIGAIVGFDVLGDTSFRLDYGARTLTFEDVEPAGVAVPVADDWPFAVASVEVEKQKLRLLVDTGAGGVLLFRDRLNRSFFEVAGLRPASVENLGGRVGAWGAAPQRLSDVTVQGTSMRAGSVFLVTASSGLKEFDGLLSLRSLGIRVLSYDHDARMLYLSHF